MSCEQQKINDTQVEYKLSDGKLSFETLDGQIYELGIVLDRENILNAKMDEWWDKIKQTITLEKIINYIKQIDVLILNLNQNSDDSYNISYEFFNELFDNTWYSRKFSRSQLKVYENKVEFVKYFFKLYGLDLDKILQLKFPNSLTEYKQNNIIITIL